jgi:ankyrin repeat protein
VKFNKLSTAHYAAVCNTTKNLEVLIENDVGLHEEDANKKTPLLWAIAAKKPASLIRTIIEDLEF